jgi:pyrroline-5-carboxylate reductase
VGTIGGGSMAEAILRGLLRAGMRPEQLIASDPLPARREALAALGLSTTARNSDVASFADLAVLAVKPGALAAAAAELGSARPLYLSIVAGCTLASLRTLLGRDARVVRAMPNTPALIGAGVSALADDPQSTPEDLALAAAVLEAVGRVVRVPEPLLDAVTGLSGSGPAYAYLFIEALGEAGVREGLPAEIARVLAAHTVAGAARMVIESQEAPAVLRERVTSPGGTTAEGLAALEARGLRRALLEAVRAATRRSRELGS